MDRVGFHLRLPADLHASVKEKSSSDGISMNDFIIKQLEYALGTDVRYVRSRLWYDDDGAMQLEFWVPEDLEERLSELHDGQGVSD